MSPSLCHHQASNFFHFALHNNHIHLTLIKPMNPKTLFCSFFLFLFIFFILDVSATSARPLVQTPKGGDDNPKQILKGVSDSKLEDNNNSIDKLMGIESCEEGDEECFKRRLLSEAHLDYIYTQHQKP